MSKKKKEEAVKESYSTEARITKDAHGVFYFQQGDVKFPVDAEDLGASCAMLDKINKGAWTSLAALNHVPSEPFSEFHLKPVLIGVVQNTWKMFFEHSVSQYCQENQDKRIRRYKIALQELRERKVIETARRPVQRVTETSTKKGAVKKENGEPKVKASRFMHGSQLYRIRDWKEMEALKGQQRIIAEEMKKLGALGAKGVGVSTEQLAEAISKKVETKMKPIQVVTYYVGNWRRNKLVEVV